ncbi:MAG: hypothetical protein ACREQ5_12995 [Candidatus Dormibacteria bacterium]
MLTSDVVTFCRSLINDPSSQGRWSDATLINFYNQAQQCLLRDVRFPQSRAIGSTVSNQQEYPIPDIIEIYRVYLAGQLAVVTTLETIEGAQVQLWDQGFNTGVQQQAPPSGSGGPPGVVPGFSPSWIVQQSEQYPFQNVWGTPAPDAQAWAAGQRPRYYLRGGSLGLVPTPGNIVSLVIDCLRVLPDSAHLTDESFFPLNFREALAWKMAEFAQFSDADSSAAGRAQYAMQKYEQRMKQHREDIERMNGIEPRMPKFFSRRNLLRQGQFGNRRNTNTWGPD